MTTLQASPAPGLTHWLKWILLSGAALALGLALMLVVPRLAAVAQPGVLRLNASGLSFSEMEIRARAGQPVTLEIFNADGYAHAFDVDAFDVHVNLPASQTTRLTFTPTQPGEFEFYCGAYGHHGAGMVGTLIVEP
jgi:uncharacterized cupredoxin-like copper-binding protein